MTMAGDEVYDLARKIRMDLTAAQAKLTDLVNLLNDLQLEDRPRPTCPHCRITFRQQMALAEHVYTSHDGPVPVHWLEAEARSLDPVQPEGR